MAVGADLLEELFLNKEVNKRVVCHLEGSLELELSGSCHRHPGVRSKADVNHTASSGTGGSVS